MTPLRLEMLTAERFEPFGDVIATDRDCVRYPINEGLTERFHALGSVDCSAEGGKAAISIFRAQPVADGFELRTMECHPLGSQAFINCSGNPYIVVVAPAGELDESEIRGFIAAPNQSVNYRRGTWHHYLMALHDQSDFVIVDRVCDGESDDANLREQPLDTTLTLVLS